MKKTATLAMALLVMIWGTVRAEMATHEDMRQLLQSFPTPTRTATPTATPTGTLTPSPTPSMTPAPAPGFQDIVISNDMLTASQTILLNGAYTKFTYEETYSVGTPFKAAATPSMQLSTSLGGNVFTAVATVASVSQSNALAFSTTGGVKQLKLTLSGATPTTTAVVTRTIHCQN